MIPKAQPPAESDNDGHRDRWPPTVPVLLFDGVCHLCQRSVKFVLRHERRPTLLFCALQSPAGRDLLLRHGLDPDYQESLVIVADGAALTRSDAALFLCCHLRPPWSWARALSLLPRPWRDWIYDLVALRRYRWFGRDASACLVPDAATRSRFLQNPGAATQKTATK